VDSVAGIVERVKGLVGEVDFEYRVGDEEGGMRSSGLEEVVGGKEKES